MGLNESQVAGQLKAELGGKVARRFTKIGQAVRLFYMSKATGELRGLPVEVKDFQGTQVPDRAERERRVLATLIYCFQPQVPDDVPDRRGARPRIQGAQFEALYSVHVEERSREQAAERAGMDARMFDKMLTAAEELLEARLRRRGVFKGSSPFGL